MLDHLPLVPMGLFMFRFSTANYMPLTVIPGLRSGSFITELIPEDVPLVWMTRFIFRMVMKENSMHWTARLGQKNGSSYGEKTVSTHMSVCLLLEMMELCILEHSTISFTP